MRDAPPSAQPLAVLFACGQNAVRSPMAAALFGQIFGRTIYVGSAGVRKGELDPFAVAVMAEIGLDISRHKPMTLEELEDWEGLNFDLIVTLTPRPTTARSNSPAPAASKSNTGRRRTRAPSRAAATSGSTRIASCGINCWRAFRNGLPSGRVGMSEQIHCKERGSNSVGRFTPSIAMAAKSFERIVLSRARSAAFGGQGPLTKQSFRNTRRPLRSTALSDR